MTLERLSEVAYKTKEIIAQNHVKFFAVLALLGVLMLVYTKRFRFVHPMNELLEAKIIEQSEIEQAKLRWNRQYGKWLGYLPKFEAVMKIIDEQGNFPTFQQSTSPNMTELFVQEKTYFVGDFLNASIESRDHYNFTKKYGGDMFEITLHRTPQNDLLIPCKVKDNQNGSYSVQCPLIVEGNFEIKSILRCSAEVLYIITLGYQSNFAINYVNSTFVNSKGESENSSCVSAFDDLSDDELCDYTNPTNGEPWFCVKPPSGECNPIISQYKLHKSTFLRKHIDSYTTETGPNGARIAHSGFKFKVLPKLKKDDRRILPTENCSAESNSNETSKEKIITGWISNGHWISYKCKNRPLEITSLMECLRNRSVYVIGDSIILRWYGYFLREKSFEAFYKKLESWSGARDAYSNVFNISLHYRSHGPPLHNTGPPSSRPFISDTLDEIPTNENPVIIVSIGEHFVTTNPDSFLNRILIIKRAIARLTQRSPTAQVFIKGLHNRVGVDYHWLLYRMNAILKSEISNEKGITFLDMWTMSILLNNRNTHPPDNVMYEQIALFQSHLSCSF